MYGNYSINKLWVSQFLNPPYRSAITPAKEEQKFWISAFPSNGCFSKHHSQLVVVLVLMVLLMSRLPGPSLRISSKVSLSAELLWGPVHEACRLSRPSYPRPAQFDDLKRSNPFFHWGRATKTTLYFVLRLNESPREYTACVFLANQVCCCHPS